MDVQTSFGCEIETRCRIPIMAGALGSTFIAAKYWDSFAVGAASCGFPVVVGENVVGVDRESQIHGGRLSKAPELERRIDKFLRYYDGYGAIIVQRHVEDTRHSVAQYRIDKYGDKALVELKRARGRRASAAQSGPLRGANAPMVDMPGTPVGDLPEPENHRWTQCQDAGHCTNPNHPCRMLQTGAEFDRIKRVSRTPPFICRTYGRVALRRASLCRPEPM